MRQNFNRGIVLLAIIVLILVFYVKNQHVYNKEYDLISIEEINIKSQDIRQGDGTRLYIDQLDNSTYIEVNEVGYIVDNEDLFAILSKYKCRRTKKNYFPYQSGDEIVEFSLIQNDRPLHILLGKFNVRYESADKEVYEILEGNQLLKEILSLVEEQ